MAKGGKSDLPALSIFDVIADPPRTRGRSSIKVMTRRRVGKASPRHLSPPFEAATLDPRTCAVTFSTRADAIISIRSATC